MKFKDEIISLLSKSSFLSLIWCGIDIFGWKLDGDNRPAWYTLLASANLKAYESLTNSPNICARTRGESSSSKQRGPPTRRAPGPGSGAQTGTLWLSCSLQ